MSHLKILFGWVYLTRRYWMNHALFPQYIPVTLETYGFLSKLRMFSTRHCAALPMTTPPTSRVMSFSNDPSLPPLWCAPSTPSTINPFCNDGSEPESDEDPLPVLQETVLELKPDIAVHNKCIQDMLLKLDSTLHAHYQKLGQLLSVGRSAKIRISTWMLPFLIRFLLR